MKDKEIDGFISAGNTGALLAGGLLKVGRIKGIDRPALGAAIPTTKGFAVLVDSGANTECKPRNLNEFAIFVANFVPVIVKKDILFLSFFLSLVLIR